MEYCTPAIHTAGLRDGMFAIPHRLLGIVNKIRAIEFSGGTGVINPSPGALRLIRACRWRIFASDWMAELASLFPTSPETTLATSARPVLLGMPALAVRVYYWI